MRCEKTVFLESSPRNIENGINFLQANDVFVTDLSNLRTVRNYAKEIDKTVQWVYTQIKKGKIEDWVIDGVIFVNEPKKEEVCNG